MHRKEYPLTLPAFGIGIAAGSLVGLIADSALLAFCVFVLVVGVGGTWRRDRAVIVPFIVAYQWLAVTAGYLYSLAAGVFPSVYAPGDLERALWLSLSGLLLLALGIRLVCWLPVGRDRDGQDSEQTEISNLSGLFWLVMGLYSVDYIYVLNVRAFANTGAIVARVLEFRQVLLLALWVEVLRRRERIRYLWLSLAWVFLPLLGSYFSEFKSPLILLAIVALSRWKPWERTSWAFRPAQVAAGLALVCTLGFVVMLWQAGVKKETRKLYDETAVSRDPIDRISTFVASARSNVPVVFHDTLTVVEGLVERVSYVTFFSRVLDHVPRVQPHTKGELFNTAITNAVMPRFLFPNKPELPSDSVYTRRFTGIVVPEEGTSISIGYMAEFYVDWGIVGMLAMVFAYGCWIGLVYRLLEQWVCLGFLLNPVLISVLMSVSQFEQQFIKSFAALNIAAIVAFGMVFVFRHALVRFLDPRPVEIDAEEDEPIQLEPSLP